MRQSKFTERQILAALKQAESGLPVNDVCRQIGVSPATFYKWRAKYGGLDASELSRMRELEEENAKLKQMYAELSLRARAMEVVIA
ncbi:MAG TPA: transposase, partial [Candidatus Acidoferrales bacterium]|nr:transposase [Candidatus Acidoferrales bacterium]